MTQLISYQQALDIILTVAQQHRLSSRQSIPLIDSNSRLLADDVRSTINVPGFNNSAMDGFAIQSQLVNEAIAKFAEIKLQVTGSIQAGDAENNTLEASHMAWEIMTGAPVPDHFDAVIQIENVSVSESNGKKFITIKELVQKGRNIRKLGTDYRVGEIVANKHSILQAQHIMALATVGISQIDVIEKLAVAIVSTGNELAKKSSKDLNSGKIFNSNQPFLSTYVDYLNCEPVFVGRCKDDEEEFNTLLDEALDKNVKIIFSTGAVSMGKFDFIPKVLKDRGAHIHFHKAKIRPGKPILFAELPNGTLYFGLPGNPIAAAAGMRFFASPFIRSLLGLAPEQALKAKLKSDITKKQGFRTFAKAYAHIDESAQLCVDMLMDQGSYQSCSFAQSNCWLILPEDLEIIRAGEIIEIVPMVSQQLFF